MGSCPPAAHIGTTPAPTAGAVCSFGGWNLGIAAMILVPAAIFIFKDRISWVNILGILVCLAGLVMLNW
jgi:multidrug transporter EmrE-like cation transporter